MIRVRPNSFLQTNAFFVLLKYNKGEKINVLIQKQYRLPEVVFLDLDRANFTNYPSTIGTVKSTPDGWIKLDVWTRRVVVFVFCRWRLSSLVSYRAI